MELHLDFGICDVMLVSRQEEATYLVKVACGCTVIVRHEQVLWRTGSFTLVCEHVAAK